MSDLDGKHVAIVVSAGRTGTAFLGAMLPEFVPDAYAVHEPDVLLAPYGANRRLAWQLHEFGLRHMVIDRLRGESGMRVLTERYRTGKIGRAQVASELTRQRAAWWATRPKPLVIEANYQFWGVCDVALNLWPALKLAIITRDKKAWVRSSTRKGSRHGVRDNVRLVRGDRLPPPGVAPDKWARMNIAERHDAEYDAIYGALAELTGERVRRFDFEDLFGHNRAQHFPQLLDFLTSVPERRYPYRFDARLLDRKINQS